MGYMEWFYLGLFLILLELFVPGVYLVWFGLAAFATGALSIYHTFSPIEVSAVFVLCSVLFIIFGWFFYSRFVKKSKSSEAYKYLNDAAGQHIGKIYTVSENSIDGRAKAIIGDSVWIIESEETLQKGDQVKVIGVENGVILKVQKL